MITTTTTSASATMQTDKIKAAVFFKIDQLGQLRHAALALSLEGLFFHRTTQVVKRFNVEQAYYFYRQRPELWKNY